MKKMVALVLMVQLFGTSLFAESPDRWKRVVLIVLAHGVVVIDVFGAYYARQAQRQFTLEDSDWSAANRVIDNLIGTRAALGMSAALIWFSTLGNIPPAGSHTVAAGILSAASLGTSLAAAIVASLTEATEDDHDYNGKKGSSRQNMRNTFALALGGFAGHISVAVPMLHRTIRAMAGDNFEPN